MKFRPDRHQLLADQLLSNGAKSRNPGKAKNQARISHLFRILAKRGANERQREAAKRRPNHP
jgi:hypothetical protein